MGSQEETKVGRSRLALLREEIEAGLERYLTVSGVERSQLTIKLLRLRWEAEELEVAVRSSAS